MIVDSFSCMVIIPANEREAFSLPELVFGQELGRRVYEDKTKSSPTTIATVETGNMAMFANKTYVDYFGEEGLCQEPSYIMALFPDYKNFYNMDEKKADEWRIPVSAVGKQDQKRIGSHEGPPILPPFSEMEKLSLTAFQYVFGNVESKVRPVLLEAANRVSKYDDMIRMGKISHPLRQRIERLSRGIMVRYPGGMLFKIMNAGSREVLTTMETIMNVLTELHDGMEHRGAATVYYHFALRYWVPALGKIICRHILAFKTCQIMSKNNKMETSGYAFDAHNIFAHWAIDFMEPFPQDLMTKAE